MIPRMLQAGAAIDDRLFTKVTDRASSRHLHQLGRDHVAAFQLPRRQSRYFGRAPTVVAHKRAGSGTRKMAWPDGIQRICPYSLAYYGRPHGGNSAKLLHSQSPNAIHPYGSMLILVQGNIFNSSACSGPSRSADGTSMCESPQGSKLLADFPVLILIPP